MLVVQENNIVRNFIDILRKISMRAKKLVRPSGKLEAYDTGDMYNAITYEDAKRIKVRQGRIEGRVFVAAHMLGDKRKGKINKNYPSIVHDGASYENRTLLPRPFLTTAGAEILQEDDGLYSDDIIIVKKTK